MEKPDITNTQADEQPERRSLLLWPGVVLVVLQWLVRFVVPIAIPEATSFGILGGALGWLAILVWWAFFSRASRFERWGAVALMLIALTATLLVLHESIATAMWGLIFIFYATPFVSLAFVLWAVASQKLADGSRRATLIAAILLACAVWPFLRMDGMGFGGGVELAWRWTETHEERLLTGQPFDEEVTHAPTPVVLANGPAWPGFLGPARDGTLHGVSIETDWGTSPPVELWRRPIGPGWSSFAVHGDLLYTQEQRGDDEIVSSYSLTTGEPVWSHRDRTRFWESIAGAGPRGTPTVSKGSVLTLGGTGIVNMLDAADGSVIWSRNAASDTQAQVPYWGFSSSPLVVDDIVIIAASGSLVAYDLTTGEPRWFGPANGVSYSSPHLLAIDGVPQILALHESGLTSMAPADGTVLWEHRWPGEPILQPTQTRDGDLLISMGQGHGLRRLSVAQENRGWTVQDHWTSTRLKPYYSEIVVHDGYAFGFDGNFLVCIDLEDGKRQWKGGRYGAGQLLLLADQGLLLVLSEEGELVLVAATPDKLEEIARFQAIEGKTWNHPVLVGDILLARNAQEMAAFRLSLVAAP